ncbi:ankyrin repeat domain-containing protein [candidate division WWE3 bacterium]|nr:ankyrin repeat domain-containing protein [candidate division WWE3 bacterium]
MSLDEFLNRIRKGLKVRGLSKDAIDFHMARLTEVYERSPIFGELEIDETYDDYQEEEFEDGVKDAPISLENPIIDSAPFEILEKTHDEQVERRIHQLRDHYQKLQDDRGEVWYPPEEETAIDVINIRGMFGRTLLIQAAYDGDLEEVEKLIGMGADVTIKDSSGNDALQIAIISGYTKVAARLKKEFVIFPFDLSV